MRHHGYAVLALALAAPLALQAQEPFDWSGRIPAGAWLRVHNANGPIEVVPASGDRARVHGEIRGDRGRDREPIRFEVVEDGDNIVICALTDRQICDVDGIETVERAWRGRGGSERAELTVELPAGVHIAAGSGNGDVSVEDAGADVRASSGNGDIDVLTAAGGVRASTGNGRVTVRDVGGPVQASSGNGRIEIGTVTGPVSANTGNGEIEVVMDRLGEGDMEFHTGNGRVTLELPAGLNAELRTRLGHGSVETDFPITITGRTDFRNFRATIGSGGRRLEISSGNGDVILRRRR